MRFIGFIALVLCLVAVDPEVAWAARKRCPSKLSDTALVAQSRDNATALLARKGTVTTKNLSPGSERVFLESRGVPHDIRLLSDATVAARTFRHYTADAATRDAIVAQGRLRAGKAYYVRSDTEGFFRQNFLDVTGIFLTTPSYRGEQVGVFKGLPYLDLKLPEGTAVIQLERGIYLIAGEAEQVEIPIEVVGQG